MAQLSETFPTLDCSQCILTPRMVELGQSEKIKLYTYSEVESVSGSLGRFKVRIKQKAAYVDRVICNGCALCTEKCPSKAISEFDRGIGQRKTIYTPFPQAVPNKPVLNKTTCIYFKTGKCRVCEKVCPVTAIRFEQTDTFVEEEVCAIIVATGYDLYPVEKLREYGGGRYKDVIDGLAFERLCSASGPTTGKILRPSDNTEPKEVVFVQCAGSRDPETACPYCSKTCCMYTIKHAMLYKHRVHNGQAYIFYIDIRCAGKDYEEFMQRGIEEDKVLYLRGKVSKIFKEEDKIMVWGADTLTGKKIEIAADMVVLASAMIPSSGTVEIAKRLNLKTDKDGFLTEAHSKLRPLESSVPGIFIAGCCQAPRDIPESVASASGCAAKVISMFSQEALCKKS